MVRKLFIIGWAMAVLMGCQSDDYLSDSQTLVRTDLALSVMATTPPTRMSTEEVLESGSRAIQELTIVPFSKQGEIEKNDRPSYYEIGDIAHFDDKEGNQKRFFYSQQYYLMPGAASFLVYGRAKTIKQSDNSTVDKSANGSLLIEMEGQSQTSLPTSVIPATLKFKPEPMYDPTPVNNQIPAPDEAKCIAAYLTAIADVYGQVESTACRWREAPNAWLKALYLNFINQGNDRTYVLAGSARNVKAYVNQLYLLMKQKRETDAAFADGTMPGAIAQAIMAKIIDPAAEYKSGSLTMKVTVDASSKVTSLGVCDGYPNNRDLPDGAAVLLWGKASESASSNSFIPQVETTTMNSVNSISRFAYPAELYYYGNSRIKTNNEVVEKSVYENASATWAGVLGNYHYDDAIVTTSTKAIAIKDPLQYGVARLSAKVHATSETLQDADNKDVTVEATSFPITGIVIDKQRPVGFDFKPLSSVEADVKFVYDSHLNTNTGNTNYYLSTTEAEKPFHTLVLQNCEDEDVTVILELENDSGQDFAGENGVIYKGTKFYLVGQIKLSEATSSSVPSEANGRVFTQDHTTTVGMKVGSLAHAYNVLPDLLGGRLEIGVQITTDWEAATPSTVIFK